MSDQIKEFRKAAEKSINDLAEKYNIGRHIKVILEEGPLVTWRSESKQTLLDMGPIEFFSRERLSKGGTPNVVGRATAAVFHHVRRQSNPEGYRMSDFMKERPAFPTAGPQTRNLIFKTIEEAGLFFE